LAELMLNMDHCKRYSIHTMQLNIQSKLIDCPQSTYANVLN